MIKSLPVRSSGLSIFTVTCLIRFIAGIDRLFNKFWVDAAVIAQVTSCTHFSIAPTGATPKQRMLHTSRHLSDNNVKKAQFIMFLQKYINFRQQMTDIHGYGLPKI